MIAISERALKDALSVLLFFGFFSIAVGVVLWLIFPQLREGLAFITFYSSGAVLLLFLVSGLGFAVSVTKNTLLTDTLVCKTNLKFEEAATLVAKYKYVTNMGEIDSLDMSSFYSDYQIYKQRGLI